MHQHGKNAAGSGLPVVVVAAENRARVLADWRSNLQMSLWVFLPLLAGLLAARVLADRFDSVTLIERDDALSQVVGRATVLATVIGTFNVSNLLAVLGALRALDVPLADAARACSGLKSVPGRMQVVSLPGAQAEVQAALPMAVVDYAHTPDALLKALQALRPVAEARNGQLWCVFGCGGDRDPIKRPPDGCHGRAACRPRGAHQ